MTRRRREQLANDDRQERSPRTIATPMTIARIKGVIGLPEHR
jgi:hypothetical protein